MDATEFLKSFAIDKWYKALLYLGGVLFGFSLFLDVKGLTNTQLQFLAGGAFLVGVGEWKNHKVAAWIEPPSFLTGGAALVQAPVRKPDFIGVLLELVGVILIGIGAWRIVSG